MNRLDQYTTGPQTRDLDAPAPAPGGDGRDLTAVGVPYGVETSLWDGYYEMFAPGSIDDDGAILRFAHRDPIGRITGAADTEAGRQITARISDTPRGREVATLLADGVLTRMSIGFDGVEHTVTARDDGTTLITWTRVHAREYSVVEFPAYDDAEILDVRSAPTQEGPTPMTVTDDTQAMDAIADLQRDLIAARQAIAEIADGARPCAPADTRSAGQFLKDLVSGDAATLEAANRLQARQFGGTSLAADALADSPVFVADLVRLIDNANPIAQRFSSGSLPSTGTTLEFGRLKSNTIAVDVQTSEGDTLVTGKLDTETSTAKIKTYGGYTELSIQAIERSPLGLLNFHLQGMAIAAGVSLADSFNTVLEAAVKDRASAALSVGKPADALKWGDLNGLVIDAAKAYSDLGLTMDGLILDAKTFKALTSMTDSAGRPLFAVTGQGVNQVGSATPAALSADLAGITLVPNFRATPNGMGEGVVGCFFSSEAIRTYASPVASLQDTGVITLTQAFSVYRYAAVATELPTALVPVKLGA